MEDFPDLIAKICIKKFDSLPRSGKPNANQWTVLSCIVEEENMNFKVVALGTGSKCIGRTKMSPAGDILNDSHAEVICRRAFIAYLYKQLDNTLTNQASVFLLNEKSKKFQLKHEIRFHFFTTMMPCGDASIFPKSDVCNSGNVVLNDKEECGSNNRKRLADYENVVCKKMKTDGDIHRTGAKCLEDDAKQDPKKEGADYHITGVVRTKPGRGDPTLSVSCSDKITKWCYLGLQGALLSIFLEKPIYLTTFTLAGGVPFSKESLQRSFFDRIGNFEMKKPYEKIELTYYHAENIDFSFKKREEKEVCPSSIIWYEQEVSGKPEVAVEGKKQGVTKKDRNLDSSRLKISKAELLKSFKSIHRRFYGNIDCLCYSKCKEKALDYQFNWKILKTVLGVWPKKSEALLKFT